VRRKSRARRPLCCRPGRLPLQSVRHRTIRFSPSASSRRRNARAALSAATTAAFRQRSKVLSAFASRLLNHAPCFSRQSCSFALERQFRLTAVYIEHCILSMGHFMIMKAADLDKLSAADPGLLQEREIAGGRSQIVSGGSELLLLVPAVAGVVGSVILSVAGSVPDPPSFCSADWATTRSSSWTWAWAWARGRIASFTDKLKR
jgi:hypothetical protein